VTFFCQALAMAIGATPSLKHFILDNDAPLFFFTDACMILGYSPPSSPIR
jgi:prophage antirepressor-like protein